MNMHNESCETPQILVLYQINLIVKRSRDLSYSRLPNNSLECINIDIKIITLKSNILELAVCETLYLLQAQF